MADRRRVNRTANTPSRSIRSDERASREVGASIGGHRREGRSRSRHRNIGDPPINGRTNSIADYGHPHGAVGRSSLTNPASSRTSRGVTSYPAEGFANPPPSVWPADPIFVLDPAVRKDRYSFVVRCNPKQNIYIKYQDDAYFEGFSRKLVKTGTGFGGFSVRLRDQNYRGVVQGTLLYRVVSDDQLKANSPPESFFDPMFSVPVVTVVEDSLAHGYPYWPDFNYIAVTISTLRESARDVREGARALEARLGGINDGSGIGRGEGRDEIWNADDDADVADQGESFDSDYGF